MHIFGFSRHGFLYVMHNTGWTACIQVHHSPSHMLNTFSSVPEFQTYSQALSSLRDSPSHTESLKAEITRLKSELDKLRQEYFGNEYDDMLAQHLAEQQDTLEA